MSEQLGNTIRNFWRPSEILKVVLDTTLVDSRSAEDVSNSAINHHQDRHRRRIAAVVTHIGRTGVEEGSIFILKSQSDFTPASITIHRIFPILGDCSITVAQARRGTLDLTSKPNQPRSELIFTINPGQGNSESMTLLTDDVQRLRAVIGEFKRLKEIYDANTHTKSYTWLVPYTLQPDLSSIFSPTPPDLRNSCQPLHKRLSNASAGSPGDDAGDIGVIREHWIRSHAREACKMTSGRQLRLRIGTFNVNGKAPSQDLSPWVRGPAAHPVDEVAGKDKPGSLIPPLKPVSPLSLGEADTDLLNNVDPQSRQSTATTVSASSSVPLTAGTTRSSTIPDGEVSDADVLILGFQELDLSAEALLYSTSTTKEDAWCMAVFAGLGEKAVLYEKLASKQLVGMLLLVIVKKQLRPYFGDIKVCAAGAGIMGVMGNKGATAVRLSFTPPASDATASPSPTTLTFVNAHLAAFEEMVERRNADFHDLSKRLNFDTVISPNVPFTDASPWAVSIYESDVLFWMGDLNYRIDLPDGDVRSILKWSAADNMRNETLLRYDQLRSTIHSKNAFQYFREKEITYPPTYRFGLGQLTDDLGYDKKRKPAWTDRILYLATPFTKIQQISYSSHAKIAMSDHRPVSADFVIRPEHMDRTEYEGAAHRLYRRVANIEESEQNPKLRVDPTTIDFGKISYMRRSSLTVALQNVGSIPCAYRFISPDSDAPTCPEWLRIEPMAGLLLAQEKTSITITAYVDKETAAKFNLGPRHIDTTLILHTALGKDHFISITGDYEYTCFANDLSRLTRLPRPIRSLQSSEDLLPVEQTMNAPTEVMRLVHWMMSNVNDSDPLFLAPAAQEMVDTIRECLDTGADFPWPSRTHDPEIPVAFAQTLLQLLDSLPEPIVPFALHTRCTQVTNRDEAFELLDEFPSGSVNVWISVTAFLHFIGQPPSTDRLQTNTSEKAERLATVFLPVLLRDSKGDYPHSSLVGKRRFLLYFIG